MCVCHGNTQFCGNNLLLLISVLVCFPSFCKRFPFFCHMFNTPCKQILAVRDVILQHGCIDPQDPGAPLCVTSQSVKQLTPFLLISSLFWCPWAPPALMHSINTANAANPFFPSLRSIKYCFHHFSVFCVITFSDKSAFLSTSPLLLTGNGL